MSKPMPSEPATEPDPEESELDAMLVKVEEKRARRAFEREPAPEDPVEVFRTRMRQVYAPVFEDLRAKYAPRGVEMELESEEFLGGGSHLNIKLRYGHFGVTLEGTVTRAGIAFYLLRSAGSGKDAVGSGPRLRIRNLTADDFRKFIVEQLSSVVKDAMRQA